MKNRFNPQEQPMFYLDYNSKDDLPYILDYLKKRSGSYAIYFNGITIAFSNDNERHAFVNGLQCVYNILQCEA